MSKKDEQKKPEPKKEEKKDYDTEYWREVADRAARDHLNRRHK